MMKKQIPALLMSVLLIVALLPIKALAVPAAVSFQITNSNSCTGTVYYKFNPGDSFTVVSVNGSVNVPQDAVSITVKAIPDGEGKINQPNSGIWIGGVRLEGVNFTALQSDTGYTYTLTDEAPQIRIEFDNNDGTGNPGGPGGRTYSVNFGTAGWTINETSVTASIAGKTLTDGAVELNDNDEIILTNFDPDTMEAALSAEDGFTATLIVVEGKTHMNSLPPGVGLPDGNLTFTVREKQNNPGPGPGPEPQPNPRDELYKGDPKSVNITIESGVADFCINNSNLINGNADDVASESFSDVQFKMAEGNTTTVDFYISNFINERYTSFKINNTEYVDQLPKPQDTDFTEKMLAACTGQLNEFTITGVPFAEAYTISATKKILDDEDADYCVVGNFLWHYDANTGGQSGGGSVGDDDALFGGNLEFVSVTYNETTYSSLAALENAPACYDWVMADGENPGMALFPSGASLTVRLVPDYGNQLVAFGPNGGSFDTDGNIPCVYTFTVARGNFHLGARFAPVNDSVVSNSQSVSEGTVSVAENTVASGTVRMTVEDGTPIEILPEGVTGEAIAALEITLDNVYYAGSEAVNEDWTQNLAELDDEATVSLAVSGLAEGESYQVIREHDGEDPEVLEAAYNDGMLSFESDRFSTYTIIKSEQADNPVPPITPVTPSVYTLTFNVNGGSSIDSVIDTYGMVINLGKYVPVKDGYVFAGWYNDKDLTSPVDEIRLTRNRTVFAKWLLVFPFADVTETDWSYEDIAYVYEKGLMQGTSAASFEPTAATSRGMIFTILYRLEGEPDVSGACPFNDVKSGSYYENAITWAAANGIAGGYGNGKVEPDDSITRGQIAVILYRYAKYKGIDVNVDENTNFLSFNDFWDISEYAKTPMMWAIENNLILGNNQNLNPQDGATRKQTAAILHRFCDKIIGQL